MLELWTSVMLDNCRVSSVIIQGLEVGKGMLMQYITSVAVLCKVLHPRMGAGALLTSDHTYPTI